MEEMNMLILIDLSMDTMGNGPIRIRYFQIILYEYFFFRI